MFIRVIEWVLQQPHVRRLHRAKHDLQIALLQPHNRHSAPPRRKPFVLLRVLRRHQPQRGAVNAPSSHVHHRNEAHAGVCLEAVRGEALVDGVQQAVVAREHGRGGRGGGGLLSAQVEDVESRGEEERELQRGADWFERVGLRIVRGEDGDMEGVVLGDEDV